MRCKKNAIHVSYWQTVPGNRPVRETAKAVGNVKPNTHHHGTAHQHPGRAELQATASDHHHSAADRQPEQSWAYRIHHVHHGTRPVLGPGSQLAPPPARLPPVLHRTVPQAPHYGNHRRHRQRVDHIRQTTPQGQFLGRSYEPVHALMCFSRGGALDFYLARLLLSTKHGKPSTINTITP